MIYDIRSEWFERFLLTAGGIMYDRVVYRPAKTNNNHNKKTVTPTSA